MSDKAWTFCSRSFALLVALGVSLVAGYGQDGKPPSVSLTTPPAAPGNPAYVILMLNNSGGRDIQEISDAIDFPKDKLAFVSARTGIAADMGGAELKLEIQDKPGGSADPSAGPMATLQISLIGRRPMPDGPLVEINLKVPQTVEEQTIPLNHRAAAVAAGGQKLGDLVSEKAELKVVKEKPAKSRGGDRMHEM